MELRLLMTVLCLIASSSRYAGRAAIAKHVILPTFSWDPRNECFKHNNAVKRDSNGIPYAHFRVDQDSLIYFTCPSVALTYNIQNNYVAKKNMYENMYMCTRDEFEKCQLGKNSEATRLVMKCDDPLDTQKLKFKYFSFGSFKRSSDGYAFTPRKTYYFIATSNGTQESLQSRTRGRCKENNMRLAIEICEYGRNCHDNNTRCQEKGSARPTPVPPIASIVVKKEYTARSPTEEEVGGNTNNLESKQQLIIDSNPDNLGVVSAKSQRKQSDEPDKKYVLYIIIAAIGGAIVGALVAVCATVVVCSTIKKTEDDPLPTYCCFKGSKSKISFQDDKLQHVPLNEPC